jgi:hypothetical protein
MDNLLWKSTVLFVKRLCRLVNERLPDFLRICRIFSESKVFVQLSNNKQKKIKKQPLFDQKKQELCTSMLKNILSISSDLLSKAFFLSESLDSISSFASGTHGKFPKSAMVFTQQKSFDMSLSGFDRDLFSNPSYTVASMDSPVPQLDLAFSSFLVAHPIKSSRHFAIITTHLVRFHGQLKGLCSLLMSLDHLAESIGCVIDDIQTRGVECICRSVTLGISFF